MICFFSLCLIYQIAKISKNYSFNLYEEFYKHFSEKTIGDKIKKLRLSRCLSQNEFSKLVEITESALNNYESHLVIPPSTIIKKLSVNVDHLLTIKNIFRRLNIKIIYSNKGEFQPSDSYISGFVENIIVAVDELEPRILSERIASGKDKKRKKGGYSSGCNIPTGYERKIINKNVSYLPLDKEKQIITFIFNRCLSIDNSTYSVKDFFTEINAKATSMKIKSLSDQTIYIIIKNPVYAALLKLDPKKTWKDFFSTCDDKTFETKKELFISSYPTVTPIVTEDLWCDANEKLRSIIRTRKSIKSDTEYYLFKDLLYCKKCTGKVKLSSGLYRCAKGCTKIDETLLIDTLLSDVIDFVVDSDAAYSYLNKQINYEYFHTYFPKLSA